MKPKRYFRHRTNFKREDICGVYFLLKGKKVVYIGMTTNIVMRLASHKKKDYDRFRLINCEFGKLNQYEYRLIRLFRPKYNRMHNQPKKESQKSSVMIYITKDRAARLRDFAQAEQKTISIVVENALENYIGV